MPKKDGTGPIGRGPMTGCCSGKCIVPLNTPEEKLNYLKNREEALSNQLQNVKARVRKLESVALRGEK